MLKHKDKIILSEINVFLLQVKKRLTQFLFTPGFDIT